MFFIIIERGGKVTEYRMDNLELICNVTSSIRIIIFSFLFHLRMNDRVKEKKRMLYDCKTY